MPDLPLEPFDSGHLDVGDGHQLYYEQVGSPSGVPVVYLHGGPGSGCTVGARQFFHPERHRAVLFDQRAAGRSRPHASDPATHWGSIDMEHHVGDIERVRVHLGIEQWIVFGISWGSVLALTYAERHVERVAALVAAAVSTGSASDIEWLTQSAARFYPAEHRALRAHIPAELRHERLVDAYHHLLMDPDPRVHGAAATAWCRWEEALVGQASERWTNSRYEDPAFRLGFARQVTHCWRNDSWLAPDEIVQNAGRLAGVSGRLIHGRLDISSPIDGPWRIHQAWSDSELIVVDDEGHGGSAMASYWANALLDLA